ncbi:MAG: hypothetical protein PUF46_06220, partial [Oscillospiraceae bacterium]|nr:hypothetical protein [Oscillospiraceae bacterium]
PCRPMWSTLPLNDPDPPAADAISAAGGLFHAGNATKSLQVSLPEKMHYSLHLFAPGAILFI